jgi:hypothetical protein
MTRSFSTVISNNRKFLPLSATSRCFCHLSARVSLPIPCGSAGVFNLFVTSPFLLISVGRRWSSFRAALIFP